MMVEWGWGGDPCPAQGPSAHVLNLGLAALAQPPPQTTVLTLLLPPSSPSPDLPGGLSGDHMFKMLDCQGCEPEGLFGKGTQSKQCLYTQGPVSFYYA